MKWLVDISIYLTVTAALILIIKNIFKNKMSAKWHYYIWIILLIRFFIPSLPQSDISIFNSVPTVNNVIIRQIPIENTKSLMQNYITGNVGVNNTKVQFAVEKTSADYIFYVWAIIAIVLFSYFVFVYISFSLNLKNMRACDKNILDLLEECKNKLLIKENIKVVIGGDSPMLKGMFRPVIILPEGYTTDETRKIFIHELYHYKYGDVFAIWISTAIVCINWFNPIIWYSFFVMRKDIELVCDQRVLEIVEDRKEYANLLLKTALRRNKFMLGTTSMQNGEKEISKRIKYIAYFRKPKVYWSIITLIIALAVGGICLTNARSSKKVDVPTKQSLLEYKTPYVGNHSKVSQIVGALKVPNGVTKRGIELLTKKQPYGIIINYNVANNSQVFKDGDIDMLQFYKNSTIIFSLVNNVDSVAVKLNNSNNIYQFQFTRKNIEDNFKTDVRQFSQDEANFKAFLVRVDNIKLQNSIFTVNKSNTFNIYKADGQCTYLYKAKSYFADFTDKNLLLTELPNIIKNEYNIDINKMSMDGTTIVIDMAKNMELDLDKGSAHAAYTLSALYKSLLEQDNIKGVKVLIDGKADVYGNHYSLVGTTTLGKDGRTDVERYFKIVPETALPKLIAYDKTNLEEVVKNEILQKNFNGYKSGEAQGEGHKILKTQEKNGHTVVYMIESYGQYGFENGIFTKVSGSGAIPTVMTFSKNSKSEYMLEDYKIPQDGSGYVSSIRKMFPLLLQKEALNANKYYDELLRQETVYAKAYLKSINREAVVQGNYVDKKLPNINVKASNKLLEKYNEYPYWIGTLETVENGQRYVYEKSFSDKGNGDGIVSFIKRKYNGEIMLKHIIEIKNGEIKYLNYYELNS